MIDLSPRYLAPTNEQHELPNAWLLASTYVRYAAEVDMRQSIS